MLQFTGLMQPTMEEKYEIAVSSCNTLKDIRGTISMPGLKAALMDSIEPVKALLILFLSLQKRCSYITIKNHAPT